ncbi:MAG: hypothetical protein AAFQ80_08100 [Cyanobacteria bacterium J06621_8]
MLNVKCLYLILGAIAFSWQSATLAETNQAARESLREQLASEWSIAAIIHDLKAPFAIKGLKFSPDGQLLAVLGSSQIAIWQLNQGKILRILPGHQSRETNLEIAPTAIAFSPDSRFLATVTWSQGLFTPDWSILVREIATGKKVLELSKSEGCRQVLFDPSGEIIYAACATGVTAWSFPQGKQLFSFGMEDPVEAIALSPDGRVMATVNANLLENEPQEQNPIQLWQLEAEKASLINTLAGHDNDIARLEFTADGEQLVSSSYDGKIKVWKWQEGTVNHQTSNLYSSNGVFSLSANSRIIAGNFHSETMIDLKTGLPLINQKTIPSLKESNLMAFSPQGQLFARVENSSIDGKSRIKLWQVGNESLQQSLGNPLSHRDNYREISLNKYWSNQEYSEVRKSAINSETDKTGAIGQDLQAIALQGLNIEETEDLESPSTGDRLEIETEFPQNNLALVTVTQSKLRDDSVEGHRYLLEFVPYGEEQWQLIWAGEQFRCWQGRGQQNWATDLCH